MGTEYDGSDYPDALPQLVLSPGSLVARVSDLWAPSFDLE